MNKNNTNSKPVNNAKKTGIMAKKYTVDCLYILAMILIVFVFFRTAIFSGGFNSPDNIASGSFKTYLDDARQTGNFPQWIPYIFGGMPSYSSLLTTGLRWWDFVNQIFLASTRFVGSIFGSDVARVIMFYVFYGLGMYLLMRQKKHSPLVAFLTGIAAIFSTYVITWVMIGHNTKPIVLAMLPYIFLLLERLRTKFSLLYAVLLVFAVHLMFEGNHVQLMFYSGCALIIYFFFELLGHLNESKEIGKVFRAGVLLVLAAGFAFLMSSDRYLATLEYTPNSTRGVAPITQIANHQSAAPTHDYKYSTSWSFTPSEMFSFLVPDYFGTKPIDVNGEEQPLYFGAKESEDSPPYMGIIFLALAVTGCVIYRKDTFVQALAGIGAFGLLISFGKNSPGSSAWYIVLLMFAGMGLLAYYFVKKKLKPQYFYCGAVVFLIYLTGLLGLHKFDMFKLFDAMFWSLPMFYTFRAPSMSLVLLHFAVPILAGYGLTGIIKMGENLTANEKKFILGTLIVSAVFLLAGLVYSGMERETYIGYVNSRLAPMLRGQQLPTEIGDNLWSAMTQDWYFSAIVLLIFAGLTFYFVKKKVQLNTYLAIIAILCVIDVWRVDTRAMKPSEENWTDEVFTPYSAVYAPIQQDKSLFRIVDFTAPHSNLPAYFRMQSVGGYHAAKLRVYQDLMDVANVMGAEGNTHQLVNPFLWNLMNVKYIINSRQQGGQPEVFPNPTVLPRAFFVKNCVVAKPMDILLALRNGKFNPQDTMYVEEQPQQKIDPADSTCTAHFTNYENEYLKLNVKASGTNMLFMSEIYYKPCWKAFVDGKETPIVKANYAFRGVVVPAGSHTVEMRYESKKFEQGKTYSLSMNILFICLGGVGFWLEKRKKPLKKAEEKLK